MPNKDDQLPSPTIELPRVDGAMNKIAPGRDRQQEGSKQRKDKHSDESILRRIRKRFDRSFQYEAKTREMGMKALKMVNGEQWDDGDLKNRAGRPTVTVNKLKVFVNQVANGQREIRRSININPEGDRGDRIVAKLLRGVIRKIERDSAADIAYDTGFWNACANGFGWWRIITDYEDAESFNQIIRIKRIRNPFTVYDDPATMEPDGADAKFRFVTEMMQREDFKEEYKGFDPVDFQGDNVDSFKNWINEKEVRLVEYFEFDNEKFTLVRLSNGWIGDKADIADEIKKLIADGKLTIDAERESERPKIMWYKATAKQIIDRAEWPGIYIPLVKVIGNEVDIEGKLTLTGVIGDALDVQRMYNFWASLHTELLSLAPKAPWVIAEGQIEGHEGDWDEANSKSLPYLLYKPENIDGQLVPAPQRQTFASIPQGVVDARNSTSQDMQAVTGIRFDATMHERLADESGRALREIRRATDIGTYHFIDNHSRSLRFTGVILVDLIPRIMDTKQILMIVREDETEEPIMIDPHQAEAQKDVPHPMKQGTKITSINPSYGKYGVTVTVGPDNATKRIEAVETQMNFIRAIPAAGPMIMDLIARNMDGEGAEQIAARLAKGIPVHLHDDPNMKGLPPQVQGMIGAQKNQIAQMTQQMMVLMKERMDTQAERAIKQDKIDKDFEAKILGILQKAQGSQDKAIGEKIGAMGEQVAALMDFFKAHIEAQQVQPPPQGGQQKV